jgi:DNA-binding NarL/FixJ family response regulator
MLAIIGDASAFNRRILRVAVRGGGVDRVLEAGRTEDLLQLCDDETPDLILVDPAIDHESPRELITVLLDRYPRTAVVVISPDATLVEWARSLGVASATKRSIRYLDQIENAMMEGLQRRDELGTVIDARIRREVSESYLTASPETVARRDLGVSVADVDPGGPLVGAGRSS